MTVPKTAFATSPEVLMFILATFTLDGETILRNGVPVRHREGANKAAYSQVHIGRFGKRLLKWKRSRLKYFLRFGQLPAIVDHASRVTRDDSLANLRAATHGENNANRRANRNKRSGLPRAVYQVPSGYRVIIKHQSKAINVGTFRTVPDAVEARNRAEAPLKMAFHAPKTRRKAPANRRPTRRAR